MPAKALKGIAQRFSDACGAARGLAEAGERVRVIGGASARDALTLPRLEYLYEIAYLRVFIAWEAFLEETFVRYMCGFAGTAGQMQPAGNMQHHPTIAAARGALYGSQSYLLWHNPKTVVARSKVHFVGGLHETVVQSHITRIEWFAHVRHRVAHGQNDARQKFDVATMNLAGRRYQGSRVGRFLRDTDPSVSPPARWLATIADELEGLAGQLAP